MTLTLTATTAQTVGPFFKIGLSPLYRDQLAGALTPGEHVAIQGHILDAQGKPVPDAVIEIWQADAAGEYSSPSEAESTENDKTFFGFGRVATGPDGTFRFSTIKPGSVLAPDGSRQAPHIIVSVFMRGLLARLVTRIYFMGDPLNVKDFVLNRVDRERRATLMATPVAGNPGILEWNVLLQGKNETVFFEI